MNFLKKRRETRALTLMSREKILPNSKRSQLTVFVIIAIVIVAAVSVYFLVRDSVQTETIPAEFQPIYTTYVSCLEEEVSNGVNILGSNGGYIELPDFEPGSSYMPFSSQLDFFGNAIPYWYYVSGNNIEREQVPSLNNMESSLEEFVTENARDCDFSQYSEQGFEVILLEPESASADINQNDVGVSLDMRIIINRGEESVTVSSHDVLVSSRLGTLYNSAREVYDYEQNTLFLEEYGIDTLRLYAPVDGVELTCSPLTWNPQEILDDLRSATVANTLAIKTTGDDFTLNSEEDKYFVEEIRVDGNVRFLTSENWPYTFEVNPTEGNLLISKPVGANQPGLGILGFCYVPYHFVYDYKYPVLVQIFEGEEIFQFPMAVIIQGNNPREALDTNAVEFDVPELCEQKNTNTEVRIFDTQLNPVNNAEISYACFGTKCDIGTASNGVIEEDFPQCVNGDIIVEAEGFEDTRYQYSTVEEGVVEIIVDRLYERDIELRLDNAEFSGRATVSFISDSGTRTIVYPEQKTIELSEGQYEVQVNIFRNSSITLPATSSQQCYETPRTGIGGFFGFTDENCIDVNFPSQVVSNVLSGGGKQNHFILESDLSNSDTIEISAQSLNTPSNLQELQENYIIFEERGLTINFI